ncbi:NADH-quinone oxidoreductase subunit NuoE [Desulfurispora thermophila]|uniref:NADH-quinone oxidoreductase subunit NuoE n=1 Tax=Desulfurispora thermophila TaxID=265470 RepID=UPI00035CCC8D|nr:NADH-quinone oxidoreductase subunit NuoE [Desulfurispora thermophila]
MACQCSQQDAAAREQAMRQALEKYKNMRGALIPLLQEAQEIYGYLPKEVMQLISRELGIPFSKTYGVATFYAQFHLKPRGRNIIRVCQGTACHVRGGAKILEEVKDKLQVKVGDSTADLRYTLETVACIGACGLAPAMMVNDDTHGRLTPEKAVQVLEQYE